MLGFFLMQLRSDFSQAANDIALLYCGGFFTAFRSFLSPPNRFAILSGTQRFTPF